MIYLFRLIRLILVICVLLFITVIVSGFGLYHYYSRDLPKLDSLKDYNPPVVSEVYSNDGTKIGEFWTEKRHVLSPKEMPKTIVQAIVASEDDRFFEHKGIDYQGILRAFFENLKAGHVVQGGSTITQQVTKSLLLSRERTIDRKIKEAILATRIEKNFNKDEILNLYLNQTFFGNRAYGVEAAAQNYFHKTCRELNIAEAAMIAGLAKAPSLYSPIANPKLAKERQEYVVDRMYHVG
ncbi:MAG: transglycosylase domain-containing protein, partial [Deltaproteobacteria bacterium]|nr:transglycosylase domain-containing protein [Deltaproteobacteria bacterium]